MPRISITTPDGQVTRYSLDPKVAVVTIGRAVDCEIQINDPSVSSFHAEIRRMTGGFCIVDCQSTAGILLNENKVEWTPLYNDCTITLGASTLKTLFTDEEILLFRQEETEHPPVENTRKTVPLELASATISTPDPVSDIGLAPAEPTPIALEKTTPEQKKPSLATATQNPTLTKTPYPGGAARPPFSNSSTTTKSSGIDGTYFIILLLICLAAVFAGMSIRHHEITGNMLFMDLLNPPKEAPKVVAPKVIAPKEKPAAKIIAPTVVKEAAPEEPEEIIPEPPPPVDKSLKQKGKYKLPTVSEFLIP